ncbi:hypothetical protein ACFYOC_24095 [Nocardiopsis alba]|uniref:hypothetical protein n=1 Tax=Nocardiopsis alba TaxID=53437 RepID=UPI0036947994
MMKRFRNTETGLMFWASPSSNPPLSFFERLPFFEEVKGEPQEPSLREDQGHEDQEEEKPVRITGQEPSEPAGTFSRQSPPETNQQLKHPKGNASRDTWLEFAQEQEPDADLSGLSRDELRRRFG